MASPLEQVKRQGRILEKIIKDNDLAPRGLFGAKTPSIKMAVLVDPKTKVIRPKASVFNTDMVIKADAFISEYERLQDQAGPLEVFNSLANMVKKETIIEIGERLVSLHTPLEVDYKTKLGINDLAIEQSEPSEARVSAKVEEPKQGYSVDGTIDARVVPIASAQTVLVAVQVWFYEQPNVGRM